MVEDGKTIFPEAFCLTEKERLEGLAKEPKQLLESLERLKSSTRNKFYGQYLNDPLDDSLLEFKRDWFQEIKIDAGTPLAGELVSAPCLISIDPAFKQKQASDFTGVCVTKTLSDNNVYVLEARGLKLNPKGLVDYIMALVDRYGNVKKVLIETVVSQIMLMDLLQNEMKARNKFFVIEEVKPENNENKSVRIRNLIPQYANRRIFHAPGCYELEEQLIEFPRGAHDDIIDSLSYQVKHWQAFNKEVTGQTVPEGSYAWWKGKGYSSRPTVIGKLFRDFRR